MKSRDEIVIIMLQWLRLYTLRSKGSRELKTFLKTRLISSRVDQKLRTKRGEYMLFKEKIGLEILGDGGGREGGFLASWKRFPLHGFVASNPRGRSLNFASKRPRISARSGRDRATIAPRSGHNRFLGRSSVGVRSSGGDSAAEAPRSRRDRGSIEPRSWSSSTSPPHRPIAFQVSRRSGLI